MHHRISFLRCKRLVLGSADVRRSVQQVSCSDGRKETQYCTANIQMLSAERPYLARTDDRLFVEGSFRAQKWYAQFRTMPHVIG